VTAGTEINMLSVAKNNTVERHCRMNAGTATAAAAEVGDDDVSGY